MEYGMAVRNRNSVLQIDSIYSNFKYIQSIRYTGPYIGSHIFNSVNPFGIYPISPYLIPHQYPSNPQEFNSCVRIQLSDDIKYPVFSIIPDGDCSLRFYSVLERHGNTYMYRYLIDRSMPVTIHVFDYQPSLVNTNNEKYGLKIFNDSGSLVFSSENKSMRVIGTLNGTPSGTFPFDVPVSCVVGNWGCRRAAQPDFSSLGYDYLAFAGFTVTWSNNRKTINISLVDLPNNQQFNEGVIQVQFPIMSIAGWTSLAGDGSVFRGFFGHTNANLLFLDNSFI
ncbi:MAG: hypothetical protein LBE22_07550 [Azoarcus sp.]|jgi:hypothetical protein|nr:hypothetical protein [Azoarcus sp.]